MFGNQDDCDTFGEVPEYFLSWRLLSEKRILSLSHGEVKEAETLNYRTLKPVQDGILGENIFGPITSYKCKCGKYSGKEYQGYICENCGVAIEDSSVRRDWFGHIELGCKVVWPLFLKGNPSIMAIVLDISQPLLMQIIYGNYYVDVDYYWSAGKDKSEAVLQPEDDSFLDIEDCLTGIDAIEKMLAGLDIEEEISELQYVIQDEDGYLSFADRHRLEVLNSFIEQGIRPVDMLTSKILVLPAALRPILFYRGKTLCSDINHNYISIINRKKRLARLNNICAPEILIRIQKRLIQHAVNNLFDYSFYGEKETKETGTLLGMIKKTHSRYLDYSGAGIVVPKGDILIEEIAIPEGILLELYKPFLINELMNNTKKFCNAGAARKAIENRTLDSLEALSSTIKDKYIIAENEQELRFVGLKVVVSEEPVLYLHPYTYKYLGFCKDKSDTLKIHVPISKHACEEAKGILGLTNNLISPYTGKLQLLPDNVTVSNILKLSHIQDSEQPLWCTSRGDAFFKESQNLISKQSKIRIKNNTKNGFIFEEETSLGRILLNECLPQDLGRVNRKSLRNKYVLEFNCEFTQKTFMLLMEEIYEIKGGEYYIKMLNALYKQFSSIYMNSISENEYSIYRRMATPANRSIIEDYRRHFENINIVCTDNNDSISINLDFEKGKLNQFIYNLLLNKILASDIYIEGENIFRKGIVLTNRILNKFDSSIYSVEVFNITVKNNCVSQKGYGGRPIKSILQSYQVFRDTLNALATIGEARNFVSILYGREPIMLSDIFIESYHNVDVPIQIRRVFKNILREDKYLYLDELSEINREEQYFVKAFACYVILKSAHIQIDFRHVELWLCLFEQVKESAIRTPFSADKNISLETLAELSICGGNQSTYDRRLETKYGKLNFKFVKNSKTIEESEIKDNAQTNKNGFEFDDAEFEFDDFDSWDE